MPRAAGSNCRSKPVMLAASSLTKMTMLAARSGIQQAKDRKPGLSPGWYQAVCPAKIPSHP